MSSPASIPGMPIRGRMPRIPRIADAAVLKARLTVVPRRRVRAARVPFVTLVSLVLLGGIVGLLLFNTSMQQASFTATRLEDQAASLSARQQTLQADLEKLNDPQRLGFLAKVKLHMVQPANPLFLRLDGGLSGVPAVATAEGGVRLTDQPPALPSVLSPPPNIVTVPNPADIPPGTTPDPAAGVPAG